MIDSRALRQEVAKRRSTFVESDFGVVPSGITYLDMLLKQTSSLDEKHLYFAIILGECVRAGNRQAELHYLRQQAELLPLQPIYLASLGAALARESGSENEALVRCSEAVSLARIEDRQVRYCLTCQARVALVLDNYGVFNRVLRELVDDAENERDEDTGYEFDFLEYVDVYRSDIHLLARYKSFDKGPGSHGAKSQKEPKGSE